MAFNLLNKGGARISAYSDSVKDFKHAAGGSGSIKRQVDVESSGYKKRYSIAVFYIKPGIADGIRDEKAIVIGYSACDSALIAAAWITLSLRMKNKRQPNGIAIIRA